MADTISHDLIIVGSGLAGLRAAISAASTHDSLNIAVVSKVQVMLSHSVFAEGGIAAVIFEEEGDNQESHMYDTIKGSDFLADQDVAELLVRSMPFEIYQLEHWGMPWSRRENGRIFINVMEIDSMLRIAEIVLAGAFNCCKSRGAHARTYYPNRDDVNFLKHTLGYLTTREPKMSWHPLTFTRYAPMERKY